MVVRAQEGAAMSKTYDRVYAQGFRAGRKATKWEKFCWLLKHRRRDVEDWLTDDNAKDADFLIIAVVVTLIGIACVLMVFAARV